MISRLLPLAATFLLASCVSIERNNPDDPGSPNYQGGYGGLISSSSSTVAVESSSSLAPSSSSAAAYSSSAVVPSSSSTPPSSSSVAPSSSSAVPSSSSVAPSSSSAVPSSSSVAVSSSSSKPSSSSSSSSSIASNVVYGDSVTYGDDVYPTVVIGTQTWFQRNLNYYVEGSKCYNDDTDNCNTYGRLYDWAMAMDLATSCNTSSCSGIATKHKGICPSSWHIPNNNELVTLMKYLEPSCTTEREYCEYAGAKLKAISGWNVTGNATDNYGFLALPGGIHSDGRFVGIGTDGQWWSASLPDGNNASKNAYVLYMEDRHGAATWSFLAKGSFRSIRCIKDGD